MRRKNAFREFFAPPVFPDEAEKTRKAVLLNTMLLLMGIVSVVIGFFAFIIRDLHTPAIGAFFVFGIFVLGLQIPMRRGRVCLASSLLVAALIGVVSTSVFLGGSLNQSPVAGYFVIATLMAGLLISRRVAAITAIASIMVYVSLTVAENNGWLPRVIPPDSQVTSIAYIAGIGLAIILLNQALRDIGISQDRARHEIAERKQAEQKALAGEMRLRSVMEHTADLILEINRQGDILYINRFAEKYLGKNIRQALPLDQQPQALEIIELAFETGKPQAIELRTIAPDGQATWDSVRLGPIFQGETVTGMTVIVTDISAKKIAETALRESEARISEALVAGGIVPYINDYRAKRFTFIGENIFNLTGYTAEEITPQIIKKSIEEEYLWGSNAGLTPEEVRQRITAGEPLEWRSDFRIRKANGESRWIGDTSVELVDESGKAIGGIGILQDITERKQAEAAVRKLEELYRIVSGISADYVFSTQLEADGKLHLEWVGGGFEQITGYTFEEYVALGGWVAMLHPEDREVDARDLATLHSNQKVIRELRTIHKNGEVRWVCVYAHPLWDEQRNLLRGIYGAVQDITERKRAETDLKQTAERLEILHEIDRALLSAQSPEEIAGNAIARIRQLIPCQRASITLIDVDRDEVTFLATSFDGETYPINRPSITLDEYGRYIIDMLLEKKACRIDDVLSDPRRNELDNILGQAGCRSWLYLPLFYQGQLIGSLNIARREGAPFTTLDEAIGEEVANQLAVVVQQSRLYQALQIELGEKKRTEAALLKVNVELEQRLKELQVLNAVAQAGASATSEDQILEAVVETLFQYLYSDIVGVGLWDEQAGVLRTHPGAHRGMPDRINEMVARPNEGVVGVVAATRQPYRIVDASDPRYISLVPGIRSELCVPILAGERLLGVLNIESRQPGAFSDSDERLLVTVAGQLASSLERLRAERQLRQLNLELEQRVVERTAQLEAANSELEAFSYSVSHDLRAPLRAINGYIQIIREDYSRVLDAAGLGLMHKVITANIHMNQLIEALLNFSRISRTQLVKQKVDLDTIVESAIESLSPESAHRQIEWIIGELPVVLADPVLLRQVFANLIGNAVKYTGKREQVRIEIGCVAQGDECILFVRDNGSGFDMRHADNLFGVFQRLHREDEFEGMGIGLAIVRRIVQRHGGRIWAEAKAGEGATFFFTLGNQEDPQPCVE